MTMLLNPKGDKMIYIGQSDNSYCVSIEDKNDKVTFIARPNLKIGDLVKLIKTGNFKEVQNTYKNDGFPTVQEVFGDLA